MSNRSIKSRLVGLIGIDYNLLEKTGGNNLSTFVWASRLIIAIVAICFLSVYYAFDLMFHMWFVQLLLSLFFCFMFSTTYVLLLQTFSKQPLAPKKKMSLNISNILRGLFILFIGFLLSKPLEILILRSPLEKEISDYKTNLSKEFDIKITRLYSKDKLKLESKLNFLNSMKSSVDISETELLNKQINEIDAKIKEEKEVAYNTIYRSDFFLQQISIAQSKFKISWIICLIIILLFAMPVILVYLISANSEYYENKRIQEEYLVKSQYDIFIYLYSQIFELKYGLKNISYYEPYEDPPFRNKKREKFSAQDQKEFFNLFS